MSDTPFKYVLSDDQTRLRIESFAGVHDLSAQEVMALVHWLAQVRNGMLPTVGDSPSRPNEIFQADAYHLARHPESGTVQLFLRMPGLGWAHIEFPSEDAAAVAKALTVDPLAASGAVH